MIYKPAIYTASKVRHAAKWRNLRAEGVNVVSTWIDYPDRELSADEMIGLWLRCASEAAAADFVLIYAEPGEVFKGALIEVGCCLGGGGRVLQVGTCRSLVAGDSSDASFTQHPNWSKHPDIASALKAAGNA